jgi:hypothetical protein
MGGYGEDGFGTIASDTVYGCAATIGVSIYTTDGQLVQQRPGTGDQTQLLLVFPEERLQGVGASV